MKNLVVSFVIVVIIPLLLSGCGDADEIKVYSPDRRVVFSFNAGEGIPQYNICFHGDTAIYNSRLGFELKDKEILAENVFVEDVERSDKDEVWLPVWGTTSKKRNNYSQTIISLVDRNAGDFRIQLKIRSYNDGAAYKFVFPEQERGDSIFIKREKSCFNIGEDLPVWWHQQDFDSYEHLYNNTLISEMGAANTPLTITGKNKYISILEAQITDYPDMTLGKSAEDKYTLESELAPWPDGVKVRSRAPFETPWRVVMISEEARGLLESDLILNLNPPPPEQDYGWIKPGKYVGIWWGMHLNDYTWHDGPKHGATTSNTKRYIDFAAENNIQGVLVEGWNLDWRKWGQPGGFSFTTPYDDFDIKYLSGYADKKGVSLIGHHETGGDILNYEKQIDSAFAYYNSLGIDIVKTGYAGKILPKGYNHHGQWMVRHYRMVVEKAMKHNIMIDAHEPIKPSGISRTFPNMMTREGVRGNEWNAWSDGNPPEHMTVIPFTRMLAGPVDYTPAIFNVFFHPEEKFRVHSTLANQLALFVVLYSPLQMAADKIENYMDEPAFEFIRRCPADWDYSIALDGIPGDYVTFARYKEGEWFLGAITDEQPRMKEIPLNFLQPEITYRAIIYCDSENTDYEKSPGKYSIINARVSSTDTLSLALCRGGGAAVHLFKPDDEKGELTSAAELKKKMEKNFAIFEGCR